MRDARIRYTQIRLVHSVWYGLFEIEYYRANRNAGDAARQTYRTRTRTEYPQGLKGGAILFEARIVAVVDVIDAMSSRRPYRAAPGIDRALGEIERGRGSAYDAECVEACLRLFREKGYRLPV